LGVFLAALVTSLGYSLTDALGPGPGFFPFWLSLIGIALTGAMLVQLARGTIFADPRPSGPGQRSGAYKPARPRRTTAALALFDLGFRLTMLLTIAGCSSRLVRAPDAIALCAVAGSFGIFHVFFYWLKVHCRSASSGFEVNGSGHYNTS
jgi:hypothetical protein